MSEPNDTHHQTIREMLGSYALEHLNAAERDQVGAHLDGCPTCRLELEEFAELAPLLSQVDPAQFRAAPSPPPELGDLIRGPLAEETRSRHIDDLAHRRGDRAGRRRLFTKATVVAAALVIIAGLGGVAIGRSTAPEPAAIPKEQISLTSTLDSVTIDDAFLVPHTWGVELRFVGAGFDEGAAYQAAFQGDDGAWTPAGEFLGTGEAAMTCNLQSAILRDRVTTVQITDATGQVVLTSKL